MIVVNLDGLTEFSESLSNDLSTETPVNEKD
jgi:hypothetical protein